MKATLMSGGSAGGGSGQGSYIVDLLLFGQAAATKKGGQTMTQSSFANTNTTTNTQTVSPVYALKYIVKHSPITQFEISIHNADGTRRSDVQPAQ